MTQHAALFFFSLKSLMTLPANFSFFTGSTMISIFLSQNKKLSYSEQGVTKLDKRRARFLVGADGTDGILFVGQVAYAGR